MTAQGFKQTQPWRAWTTDGKQDVRGYVTEWLDNRFAFLTIRGSGHMVRIIAYARLCTLVCTLLTRFQVPQFRSQAAFSFLQRWLSGSDYPTYVKPATAPRRRVGV